MDLKNIVDGKKLAEIEDKLKDTKLKLEKMVREHPLTSVAIALGLGYVLARILEKHRR